MVLCPQCGAELQISEQELHPACPYCRTAFLLDGDQAARHLIVPFSHRGKDLVRIARDHLTRAGFVMARWKVDGSTEIQSYFFPYRRAADGSTRAAFEFHVSELERFSLPGSDWKIFRPTYVEAGDTLLEPTAGEPTDPGASIVHYPFARLSHRRGEEDLVLWIDGGLGHVVATNLRDLPRPSASGITQRLLTVAALCNFGIALALPFPWSLGAGLLAAPILYWWGIRTVRSLH